MADQVPPAAALPALSGREDGLGAARERLGPAFRRHRGAAASGGPSS